MRYTAPVGGTITAINRGEQRAFQSVVIRLSDQERDGQGPQVAFASAVQGQVASLTDTSAQQWHARLCGMLSEVY